MIMMFLFLAFSIGIWVGSASAQSRNFTIPDLETTFGFGRFPIRNTTIKCKQLEAVQRNHCAISFLIPSILESRMQNTKSSLLCIKLAATVQVASHARLRRSTPSFQFSWADILSTLLKLIKTMRTWRNMA